MNFLETIILGIIQGLTEFIPISSSGHLDIVPRILGWQSPSTVFILFLHLGTLLSLLVYYRKLILRYLKVLYKFFFRKGGHLKRKEERDFSVLKNVVIAILPALPLGVIGTLLTNFYDTETNLKVIGPLILIPMIVFGVIFLFEKRLFKNNNKELSELGIKRTLLIGVSQTIAIIRGVSRSGITLLAGQAMGLKRVEAAEFSFLISIPILTVTSIYSTYQLLKLPQEQLNNELGMAVVGMITAFIFGLIAVSFLLRYLKQNSLKLFGIYRIIFGVIALLYIFR